MRTGDCTRTWTFGRMPSGCLHCRKHTGAGVQRGAQDTTAMLVHARSFEHMEVRSVHGYTTQDERVSLHAEARGPGAPLAVWANGGRMRAGKGPAHCGQ